MVPKGSIRFQGVQHGPGWTRDGPGMEPGRTQTDWDGLGQTLRTGTDLDGPGRTWTVPGFSCVPNSSAKLWN